MKLTHDDIVKWMNGYFATYNEYAQDAATVHRMDEYFAPDLNFVPYMYVFGGPGNPITGREDFYRLLTGHPTDYERFEVLDVFVDEKCMVAVDFRLVAIHDPKTDKVQVRKHYLPLYELFLDDKDRLKIKTVRFFWEASQPEVDAHYAIPKDFGGTK